ncbi:MAG: hypothetical protein MJ208_03135 [Bacilli bacterium]|nr:hypothetical protein [Bacilli bacterium]
MKKKMCLFSFILLPLCLIACGNKPGPSPEDQVDVLIKDSVALILEGDNKATINKEYSAKIVINDEYKEYCHVPSKITSIFNGAEQLNTDNYTYQKENDFSASLKIFENVITQNITIYASAEADTFDVTLEQTNKYLMLTKTQVTVGDAEVTQLVVNQQYISKYELPLSVKVSVSGETLDTKKVSYDSKTGIVKIPDPAYLNGPVTITADAYQPEYDVKFHSPSGNLEFTGLNKAKKGENYTFNIESTNGFSVPEDLKITVNRGAPLVTPQYIIDKTDDQNASVSIMGEHVSGVIAIEGDAIESQKFAVVFVGSPYVHFEGEVEASTGNDYVCVMSTVMPMVWEIPAKDNIVVRIGDGIAANAWYKPGEAGIVYETISIGKNVKVKLTIPSSFITPKEGESLTLTIAAKPANMSLFTQLTKEGKHDEVKQISDLGLAPYLFNIGEVSYPVKQDNINFQSRIIDFNRDAKYDSDKACGMTLQFVEPIPDTLAFASIKAPDNTYFEMFDGGSHLSNLYTYLSTILLAKTPFQKYLTVVRKKTIRGLTGKEEGRFEEVDSPNVFFPLSLAELHAVNIPGPSEHAHIYQEKEFPIFPQGNKDAYAFYKDSHEKLSLTCWTRTPSFSDLIDNFVFTNDNGNDFLPVNVLVSGLVHIAPAYCA